MEADRGAVKLICLGDNGNSLIKRTKVMFKRTCPSIRKLPFYLCFCVLSVGSVLSSVVSPNLWQSMVMHILYTNASVYLCQSFYFFLSV